MCFTPYRHLWRKIIKCNMYDIIQNTTSSVFFFEFSLNFSNVNTALSQYTYRKHIFLFLTEIRARYGYFEQCFSLKVNTLVFEFCAWSTFKNKNLITLNRIRVKSYSFHHRGGMQITGYTQLKLATRDSLWCRKHIIVVSQRSSYFLSLYFFFSFSFKRIKNVSFWSLNLTHLFAI